MLAGPAGVGKTRLAREAAAAAERGGETVRWVRATRSASPIPLGAFAPLLPPEELGEGGAQLRRAADALRAGSDEQFLLVVDDVQFLDETSAALLLQLVVMGAAYLVATLRTGEDPPDAVVALWKDELVERQEVRPLSPDDVTTLLGLVLGEVEASTALALARERRESALPSGAGPRGAARGHAARLRRHVEIAGSRFHVAALEGTRFRAPRWLVARCAACSRPRRRR